MKKFLLSVFTLASASFANAQCTDLFFSEYNIGSGNNKGMEIYNPTNAAINLSGYSVNRYSNGSSTITQTMNLSGTIPAYGTWVVVNGQTADEIDGGTTYPKCDPAMQGFANQLSSGVHNGTTDPLYFNGNDALTLEKGGNKIDIFGKIGENPGGTYESWSTTDPYSTGLGTFVTSKYVMIRKSNVKSGVTANPAKFNPMAEWDTLARMPANNWTKLGVHTCECDPNGIAKINRNDDLLVLYPNPTNGNLSIDAGKLISIIEVFNVIGESLISTKTSSAKVVVETEKLNKGVYFVVITYADKSLSSSRFIKE